MFVQALRDWSLIVTVFAAMTLLVWGIGRGWVW